MSVTDLWNIMFDPDIAFFRMAVMMATLASVAFGIMGTYVVTRRISYLAGAIAHCVFGGIGAGLFLQKRIGLEWFDPMLGAIVAALLAALLIGLVSTHASQREDTVIGALWAIGMAVGLVFIDLTPGYFDAMSYLFGDILLISRQDLLIVALLDVVVVGVALGFNNYLLAACFDDEFAVLRGIPVNLIYLLLLCLTALTVVLLVRVVGIIMVIALLTIPAAIAGYFVKTIRNMMVLAILLCVVFNWVGLAASYTLNLSSGATVILVAGTVYLAVSAGFKISSRLTRPLRLKAGLLNRSAGEPAGETEDVFDKSG
ncbi:MAG: metal ABC transporter permease [Desulfosudaceae bacterium]